MVFLHHDTVPDYIDRNVPIQFAQDLNAPGQLGALDLDEVFPPAFFTADVLQQRCRSSTVFQFQHLVKLHAPARRDVIQNKTVLDPFNAQHSSTFFPVSGSGMPSSARMMAIRIYTPLCT